MPDPKTSEFPTTIMPWVCQNKKHCRHAFPHIHIVQIKDLRKVMIDGCFVEHIKFQCTECGAWNYHNQNEARIEEQNQMVFELLAVLHGQKVEPIETENESAIITSETNLTG